MDHLSSTSAPRPFNASVSGQLIHAVYNPEWDIDSILDEIEEDEEQLLLEASKL